MTQINRRAFIAGGAIALAGGAVVAALRLRGEQLQGTLLSAFEDARGDQFVGGVSLERRHIFGARVPVRGHGCAVDPKDPNRILFFARRPGTQAFELDLATRQARTVFATGAGRHLAGHGVFSPGGDLLYVPEHDYERVRGVISVRDARTLAIVHEIDTHGIDPHEVVLSADGRTLLVANGGIMTHPRTFRRKLNIPTMDPSLSAIDRANGECLGQWRLPDHLLSIRHLALTTSGAAAIGLQYEGERAHAPGIVALYRPGKGLQLLDSPEGEHAKFHGYVASVAISEQHDLIVAACPYGEGVACWGLTDGRYRGFFPASETYGLARLADGSVLGSRRDGMAYRLAEPRLRVEPVGLEDAGAIRWDDHWTFAGHAVAG
jgi:hypothetical protein